MTFTDEQQTEHRAAFINECRQKAWGAACHADWVAKGIDELLGRYQKVEGEDRTLEADIKELEAALDSHTVDNRNKRKGLQEKRNNIAEEMTLLSKNANIGQRGLADLYQRVESSLQLAKHAESWGWKEVEMTPDMPKNEAIYPEEQNAS